MSIRKAKKNYNKAMKRINVLMNLGSNQEPLKEPFSSELNGLVVFVEAYEKKFFSDWFKN